MNKLISKNLLNEGWRNNLVLGHLGQKTVDEIELLTKEFRSRYDIFFINYKNSMLGVGGVGTVTRALLKVLPGLNMVCYDPLNTPIDNKNIFTVPLKKDEARLFHGEYSKLYLWPVLHSTEPNISEKRLDELRSIFTSTSKAFADESISVSKGMENPIYWVNDYNLAGVVGHLRDGSPNSKIIFSLRTPFGVSGIPDFHSDDVEILLSSLLKADIISFHREADVKNFIKLVAQHYKDDSTVYINRESNTISVNNHTVIPRAFVMGNDPEYRSELLRNPESSQIRDSFRAITKGKVITSVSRFDVTKGVDFELDCIETLLEDYPDSREEFTFLRVSYLSYQKKNTPAYKESYDKVLKRIDHINGLYGNENWRPIVAKFERKLSDIEMVGLFRATDVLLIGSLGDGFNHIVVEAALGKGLEDSPMSIITTDIGATDYLQGFDRIDHRDVNKSAKVIYNVLNDDPDEIAKKYRKLHDGAENLYAYNWALSIFQSSVDISQVPAVNKLNSIE